MVQKGKILITGAAGFIGSHLVDLLLSDGVPASQLRLLIPKKESLQNLPNIHFDIVRGDIRDAQVVKEAITNVSVVYHLAAKIDFDGKNYDEYKDVNVDGTQLLLDACKGKNISKFVFFSSIGVFGMPADVGNILWWDESHSKTYTNFYGQSKWEGELRVMRAHKEFGLPYAIVRPASVYGPREKGPTLGLYKAIAHKQFFMIGNGMNLMHYVFVKDLVRGARQAELSKQVKGDYILAGKELVAFRDVVAHVSNSIHAKVLSFSIPKPIAMILAFILQIFGNVIGWKPPLFPSRVKTMTTTYCYSIAKARKEIGYQPSTSFLNGTKETGEWYLRNASL